MGVTEVHKTYDIRPFQDALLKTGRVIEMSSFASLMNIREPVREQSCYEFVELFFFCLPLFNRASQDPKYGSWRTEAGKRGGFEKNDQKKRKEKRTVLYRTCSLYQQHGRMCVLIL